MTEEQLRSLVRDAIARALPGSQPPSTAANHARHPSHGLFVIPAGGDNGACIIEPAVPCTHCGFCKSYGH